MSIIPNKNLGLQDFSKIDRNGVKGAPTRGMLPFEGNENEMIIQPSLSDLNQLMLVFCIKKSKAKPELKSLNLIASLLGHEGDGSLSQCLKSQNFISSIAADLSEKILTPFRYFTLQIQLTDLGLQSFEKVLALTFEYIRTVREEWLL